MTSRLKRRKPPRMTDKTGKDIDCRPHLQWVRGFECCVAKSGGCYGSVQAHHVRKGSQTGMSQTPGDDRAVPLCVRHHDEAHHGARTFDRKHNINLASMAMELWLRSSHGIRWRREQSSDQRTSETGHD